MLIRNMGIESPLSVLKSMVLAIKRIFLTIVASVCFSFCVGESLRSLQLLTMVYNWLTARLKAMNNTKSTTEKTENRKDIYATTTDFVTKYGYPVETHTVTTEDGYLLTIYRIPGSPKASSPGAKGPVFLQHGIFAASDCWVLMGPGKGLGFLLADQGYDVWIGNVRGNYYSRKHVALTPKDPKFWTFTWHEMGVYDLPAVIDHILKVTHQPQLFYIGHSMGATIFFVLTSMRPEYNQKIRLMVALAPAVFVKNVPLSLKTLVDSTSLLYTLLPMILSHVFNGSSLNTLIHYSQISYTDRFQLFDPSIKQGKLMPEYDLSNVTSPVSIYYAMNDSTVHPDGVLRLCSMLPNVAQVVRLTDDSATHSDFVTYDRVKHLVYDDVLEALQKHQQ